MKDKGNRDLIDRTARFALQTSYWLELLTASAIAKSSGIEQVARETEELISIFVAVVKAAKRVR